MSNLKIIHNAEDKALRKLSRTFVQGLLNRMGIKSKVKKVLNTGILNSRYEDRFMDCLVLLDNDEYLVIEFQSTIINDDIALRFIEYVVSVKKEYDKNCKMAIIYTANNNISQNQFQPIDAAILNTDVYKFKEFNGDEILNELKNKIQNKKELNETDLFDLGAILLYNTKENINKYAIKTAKLINKIDYLPKNDYNTVIVAQIMIANKYIKDSEIRKKIRRLLNMEKSLLQEEREEGIIEGREEGLEKGMKEGLEKGINRVAKNMRSEGADINYITKVTGLTKEQINLL